MNKDIYQSAMKKVKLRKEFHENFDITLEKSGKFRNSFRLIRFIPVLLILCLVISMAISQAPAIRDVLTSAGRINNSKGFKIIEENTLESASYISVVYLDGYAYEPSEWLKYSLGLSGKDDYASIKGEKLGEVTLDLKGKKYTGTPPDFSSTYDVGTEIYEIINIDKESGILVNFNGSYSPFYRCRKYVSDLNEPLNLTMTEVFNMLSAQPQVVSLELRDEQNGAWMGTSEDDELISLVNNELPGLSLLNYGQIENDPYNSSYRVPVNLIFADGRALHMQVFPPAHMAFTFGGFIPISEELSHMFQTLNDQGSKYPRLSDMIPYDKEAITYLYLQNHTNGDEVLCENPAWSREGLLNILSYYRVEEINGLNSHIVMTARMGKSEADCLTINFYETTDKQILTEINGGYFKPVRGQLLFESLNSYLYNSTDMGSER